jgi:hypothetical protein
MAASANALVGSLLDMFPGFCDYVNLEAPGVAPSRRCEAERGPAPMLVVHFHKQAQIVVAALWAALGRRCHCGSGSI